MRVNIGTMAIVLCWTAAEEFGPDTDEDVEPTIPAAELADATR